jgi:CRISPR-associated endonuclease Cas1
VSEKGLAYGALALAATARNLFLSEQRSLDTELTEPSRSQIAPATAGTARAPDTPRGDLGMQPQGTAAGKRGTTRKSAGGVITARGYGVTVKVHSNHLIVSDGFGRRRRTRRFHRTDSGSRSRGLRRLVIIGRSGYITLDALRWLHDTGAEFLHLDTSSELITASVASEVDLAALRRAQALAADGPAGVEIARHMLTLKVEGQRDVAFELARTASTCGATDAAGQLDWCLSKLRDTEDLAWLLTYEAAAAAVYWDGWAPLPLRFPQREIATIPEHWRTFGGRSSLITGAPRKATNPANAILNYLYALLEAETIFACHTLGLDPGLGIFHRDRGGRSSMALDLMEAARPAVDAYVLAMLTQRTLSGREFVETREGACRITPRLAEQLADTCEVWRTHIAPIVEWAANTLARYASEASSTHVPTRAPLTQAHRRAALDDRLPTRKPRTAPAGPALPPTCRACGKTLMDGRQRYCEECRRARWIEQASRSRRTAGDVSVELRDGLAEQLHAALVASGDGMTRTQIQRSLSRTVPGDRIQASLDRLAASGRAQRRRVKTGGRPAELWLAAQPR